VRELIIACWKQDGVAPVSTCVSQRFFLHRRQPVAGSEIHLVFNRLFRFDKYDGLCHLLNRCRKSDDRLLLLYGHQRRVLLSKLLVDG
jgi:hypothetical protein